MDQKEFRWNPVHLKVKKFWVSKDSCHGIHLYTKPSIVKWSSDVMLSILSNTFCRFLYWFLCPCLLECIHKQYGAIMDMVRQDDHIQTMEWVWHILHSWRRGSNNGQKQSRVGSSSLEGEVSRVVRQPSQARGVLVYIHNIVEWLSNIILCCVVACGQRGSSFMLVA